MMNPEERLKRKQVRTRSQIVAPAAQNRMVGVDSVNQAAVKQARQALGGRLSTRHDGGSAPPGLPSFHRYTHKGEVAYTGFGSLQRHKRRRSSGSSRNTIVPQKRRKRSTTATDSAGSGNILNAMAKLLRERGVISAGGQRKKRRRRRPRQVYNNRDLRRLIDNKR